MAGREGDVIAQRQQVLRDGADQVTVVAAREVGAADAPVEQHVAHEGVAGAIVEEHDMARRVARAVQHLQRLPADADFVAIVQPARGREGLGLREAEHLALLRQGVDPELVAFVGADDGQGQRARQRAGAAGVVDVRVREPQRLERQATLFDRLQQLADVAARVDQGGLVGFVAPDKGAVLFEGGDGEGEAVEHAVKRRELKTNYRTLCQCIELRALKLANPQVKVSTRFDALDKFESDQPILLGRRLLWPCDGVLAQLCVEPL